MAKPKKQGREERLRKKRLAEKKRYQRIKENEDLWKLKQEKNRQSYLRRKQEKKQLSIKEMNPREQRLQRKKWRKNFKSYYLRKKQEKRTIKLLNENTPPLSPINISNDDVISAPDSQEQDPRQLSSPGPSIPQRVPPPMSVGPSTRAKSHSSISRNSVESTSVRHIQESRPSSRSSPFCSSQTVRQMRYKKDKEIKNLKQIIMMMKKKNECFRKQIGRLQKEKNNTPASKFISGSKKVIKKRLRRAVKKRNKKVKKMLTRMPEELKKRIEMYYEDDENSRMCSGKKEFIVRNKIRKQKRYLNDSLLNLHRKFLLSSSFAISYSAFCKMRPFWVLEPNSKTRDTCLCSLHTNLDLLVDAMYRRKIIPAHNGKALLALLCCDTYDVNCLHRKCSTCKDRVIPYQEFDNSEDVVYSQWVTKQDDIKSIQKKIRITEKVKIKEEPLKCIEKLESKLNEEYFMHCGNIVAQQKAFKTLKNNLNRDECVIHMDFSENYAVKCNQEVQSYNFGGSRKQITLHTSVLYFMDDDEKQQVQSFCTVSDCPRHDVAAVWAHIVPILMYLSEKNPNMQTVHFISDSPSSQYRNKKIFHLISSLQIYLSEVKTVTWNYSEAGHGKGAPDGVGAALKSAADRAVSHGQDIKNLDDFMGVVTCAVKHVILRTVTEYDVSEKDFLIPQTVKPFVGSMKMHQIIWSFDLNVMAVRKLSCTENECLYKAILCAHDKHLGFYNLINNVSNITPSNDSRICNMGSTTGTGRTDIIEDNSNVTPLSDSRNCNMRSSSGSGCTDIIEANSNVTPLCESRNIEVGCSFWTGRTDGSTNVGYHDNNQQRKQKDNTKLHHKIREKGTTKLLKNTEKPQTGQKKRSTITKKTEDIPITKDRDIAHDNNQQTKKKKNTELYHQTKEKKNTSLLKNTEKPHIGQKERSTITKKMQDIPIPKALRSDLASVRIKLVREGIISKGIGRANMINDTSKVTPLSESRNIQVGSSFWTGLKYTHDNNQKTKEKEDGKLNHQATEKNNTKLLKNTEKPQTGQKKSTITKNTEDIPVPKASRSDLASVRIKSVRERIISKETVGKVETTPKCVGDLIDEMWKDQEDLENLSFSNDFNVDLENIHKYTVSDDDDDSDYNIYFKFLIIVT